MEDSFLKVCITSTYNNKPCINTVCKYHASCVKIEDAKYSRIVQYVDTEHCKGYKFQPEQ